MVKRVLWKNVRTQFNLSLFRLTKIQWRLFILSCQIKLVNVIKLCRKQDNVNSVFNFINLELIDPVYASISREQCESAWAVALL